MAGKDKRKARKGEERAAKRTRKAEEEEEQAEAPAATPAPAADAPFVRGRAGRVSEAAAAAAPAVARGAADEDTLFGVRAADKLREKKKKAKKAKKRRAGDAGDDDEEEAAAKRTRVAGPREAPAAVHPVSFSSLKQGHLLMGYVRAINQLDLTVGLPGGLSGFVSVREVSDTLAELVDRFLGDSDNEDEQGDDGDKDGEAKSLLDLSRYVKVGQLVPVAVVGLERRDGRSNRIELTMRPAKVNAGLSAGRLVRGMPVHGAVRSVEERGVVVDLGLEDGVTGFLPFSRVAKEDGDAEAVRRRMAPGRPLACVVRSGVAEGDRIVQLSRKHESATFANDRNDARPLAVAAIRPGLVVEARVQDVLENGLFVSFLGFFYGCVTRTHLPAPATDGWQDRCRAGQSGRARVIWVDPEKKRVLLSMRPELTGADAVEADEEDEEDEGAEAVPVAAAVGEAPSAVGDRFDTAEVVRLDAHEGVLLRLDEAGERFGYAHISRLSDDGGVMARNKISKERYGSGTRHAARVVGYSALDGLLQVSLQPSVLEAPVLRASDARPGMKLRGEVLRISAEHGMTVGFARGVRARCTAMHLSDVRLREPQRKLPAGKAVQVRVLRYDAERDRLHVTNKRTLVKSELPVVDSYETANKLRGRTVHGFVTSARDAGCIVEFYGGVCGRVAADEMRRSGIAEKPDEAYTPGQVVQVRILRCRPEKKRLVLSFSLEPTEAEAQSKAEREEVREKRRNVALRVAPGTVVKAGARVVPLKRATELAGEAGLRGEVRPEKGSVFVEVEVSDVKAGATRRALGVVAAAHLSDHAAHGAQLAASLEALRAAGHDEPLGEMVALRTVLGGAAVQLSAKPSLVAAAHAKCLPAEFGDLHEGQLLSGYVSNVQKFGVFVGFAGSASALAPIKELSDQFVANPAEHFSLGQSVRALVRQVTSEGGKRRATVTLRPSVCDPAVDAADAAGDGEAGKWVRLAARTTESYVESLEAERAALQRHAAVLARAGKDGSDDDEEDEEDEAPVVGAEVSGTVTTAKSNALVVRVGESDEPAYVVVRPYHAAPDAEYKKGETVTGCVMDADVAKGIVDLSLRPALVEGAGKAGKRLARAAAGKKADKATRALVGTEVRIVVEYVKKDRLVVSLPEHGSRVGVAAARTYNLQVSGRSVFQAGYRGTARVLAATEPLLLAVDLNKALKRHTEGRAKAGSEAAKASDAKEARAGGSKDEFFDSSVRSEADLVPGRVVQCRVLAVGTHSAVVAFSLRSGRRLMGRVHVSEMLGAAGAHARGMADSKTNPLELWREKIGSVVPLKVLTRSATERKVRSKDGRERTEPALIFQLTARPADLAKPDREAEARPGPDDVQAGQRLLGFVDHVSKDPENPWIVVNITPTVRGRVGAREISERANVLKDLPGRFPTGRSVSCVVLGRHSGQGNDDRFVLSLTRKDGDVVAAEDKEVVARQDVAKGSVINARVSRVLPNEGLLVEIGPARFGRVHMVDVADEWPKHPLRGFKAGQQLRARVLDVREVKKRSMVDLSLAESALAGKEREGVAPVDSIDGLAEGDLVRGYVKNTTSSGCFVHIGRSVVGRVLITNLSDDYVREVEDKFKPGKLVTGRVVGLDKAAGRVELSLKKSVVSPDKAKARLTIGDLKEGQLVRCVVRSVAEFGAFMYIDHSDLRGLVHKSEMADEFVDDTKKLFEVGQKVKAVVLRVDVAKGRINLGTKPGMLAEAKAKARAERAEAGSDAEASGSDSDADSDEEEEEDEESGKVLVAVGDEDEDSADGDDSDADYRKLLREAAASGLNTFTQKAGGDDSDSDAEMQAGDDSDSSSSDSDSDSSDSDSSDSDSEDEEPRAGAAGAGSDSDDVDMEDVPSLAVPQVADRTSAPAFFNGNAAASSDSESGSEDGSDSEDAASRSAARSAKARAKKREERRIAEHEAAMLDQERAPESAADFERLLVGSPNNSYLWIQYVAFQLGLSDIEKARAVARRGLSTINFREESERLNVWVALLNLENMYGSPKQLARVFKEALQCNDAKQVRLKMCDVYERSGKLEQAEECFKMTCRKCGGDDPSVWVAAGQFHFRHGAADKARAVMQKAVKTLPRADHVALITKFARMEYREEAGSEDRGRTLFEGVLASYPKKVDVWSVYLDMEMTVARRTGNANQQTLRQIFERALQLNLSSKKMKFVFKRYLGYERELGDAEGVAHVKELASGYVESKLRQMQASSKDDDSSDDE